MGPWRVRPERRIGGGERARRAAGEPGERGGGGAERRAKETEEAGEEEIARAVETRSGEEGSSSGACVVRGCTALRGHGAREGDPPPLVTAAKRQDFPHRVHREMGADPCPQTEAGPTPPPEWCGGTRRHEVRTKLIDHRLPLVLLPSILFTIGSIHSCYAEVVRGLHEDAS